MELNPSTVVTIVTGLIGVVSGIWKRKALAKAWRARSLKGAMKRSMESTGSWEMGLCNGIIIRYAKAELLSSEWVRIPKVFAECSAEEYSGTPTINMNSDGLRLPYHGAFWPMGLDVRLDQIVWVAEAPAEEKHE